MTLEEFDALDIDVKLMKAMEGNFVDVRIEDDIKIVLYSHPEFYAEVFYDSDENRVIKCRAFTSIIPLAAYINLN